MRHWRMVEEVERVPITVVEVEPFPTKAAGVSNDEERLAFISFIANNPDAGDLIPGSGVFERCAGAALERASVAESE